MDRRIQIKTISNVKKDYITFTGGDKKYTKDLNYKKNDIIFIEENNDGKINLIKQYLYCDAIDYFKKNTSKNQIENHSLAVNKFGNMFNLEKEYDFKVNKMQLFNEINHNVEDIKNNLKHRFEFISFDAEVLDKLIIGLGGESVFETDITLHHTYGIPYIPGQAIKGVLRNYIITKYFKSELGKDNDGKSKWEKEAMKNKEFIKIFGGGDGENNNTGHVIFMDSFPNSNFKIKRDIMTPHHMDYYSGNEDLPLDSDGVNPLKFLVVDKASEKETLKFNINVAVDIIICNENWRKDEIKPINKFILDNLIEALNFHGVGAKTSVGYGYFDIIKE